MDANQKPLDSTAIIQMAKESFEGYKQEEYRNGRIIPPEAEGHFFTGFTNGFATGRFTNTTINYLKELSNLCKGPVTVFINEHRSNYETAEQEMLDRPEMYDDIDPKVKGEIIRTDNLVTIQFYPYTPIGFFHIHHHDLDKGLEQAYLLAKKVITENDNQS